MYMYMHMHIYSTNTYETESLSISKFNNGKLGILAVTLLFREVAPTPSYLENCIHKTLFYQGSTITQKFLIVCNL